MKADAATGLDLNALLERIHGNRPALRQLVNVMLTHLPGRIDGVERAARSGDIDALADAAHALKGSLSNFTTGPSWRGAGAIERSARTGDLDAAIAPVAQLRSDVDAVIEALRSWQNEQEQAGA
ncbi:MAG: Hpt domain-containing protein [Deltaproteobacteria bacterium]|nr:Hpt domain-containing protein [Deltaproteobacteria bacterium]